MHRDGERDGASGAGSEAREIVYHSRSFLSAKRKVGGGDGCTIVSIAAKLNS